MLVAKYMSLGFGRYTGLTVCERKMSSSTYTGKTGLASKLRYGLCPYNIGHETFLGAPQCSQVFMSKEQQRHQHQVASHLLQELSSFVWICLSHGNDLLELPQFWVVEHFVWRNGLEHLKVHPIYWCCCPQHHYKWDSKFMTWGNFIFKKAVMVKSFHTQYME